MPSLHRLGQHRVPQPWRVQLAEKHNGKGLGDVPVTVKHWHEDADREMDMEDAALVPTSFSVHFHQ